MLTKPFPLKKKKIMQFSGEKCIFSKDERDCEAPLGATSVSTSYGVPINCVVGTVSQRTHSCHHMVHFEMLNKVYSQHVRRAFTAEQKGFGASQKSSSVFWLSLRMHLTNHRCYKVTSTFGYVR